jgi:hypothetical protein
MTIVETIEQQVKNLNPEELAEFREWFLAYEWERWDHQLESDAKAGKLDDLMRKAREHRAGGRTKPL